MHWFDIALGVAALLGSALLGALLALCRSSSLARPPPPKRSQKLGDPKYDIQDIVTPAAAGTTLRLLSWLLADSPLGPLIRRVLLSQETNGSALLQDLALQASHECGNFAMWHPMQRLSSEERKQQEEAAKVAGPEEFLQKGFGSGATTPYVTVEDFAKAYREKRTTPSQTMEKLLQCVKELQPKFRPFVKLLEEDVRRQAQESDRRFRSGEARSIFEGVPVAVKDMFRIRGYPMLEGSLWPEGSDRNSPAEKDNHMVHLFREAGAIIVGTTAMTEFGVTPLGYSVNQQGPFNAYNAKHYSLGSSSGSAVAVALGLVPVAIGADAGGSIRLPASAGGVFGLATTYGRVADDSSSVTHGSMQKSGPIAATARDTALAYAVMSAAEPGNFYSQLYGEPGLPPLHLKDFSKSDLKGMRLGIFWDYFNDCEVSVLDSCQRAVDTLRSLGAEIVAIEIPHLRSLQVAHGLVVSAEISTILGDLLHNKHQLEPSTRIQFALGISMGAVEIQSGNMVRGWAVKHIRQEIFKKLNISGIVTPTVGVTPPEIPLAALRWGESNTPLLLKLMKYIFLGNLCGFPGISIPVGYDEGTSIPIGLHILGDQWQEAVLLRMAEALEQQLPRRTPPNFVNLLGKD